MLACQPLQEAMGRGMEERYEVHEEWRVTQRVPEREPPNRVQQDVLNTHVAAADGGNIGLACRRVWDVSRQRAPGTATGYGHRPKIAVARLAGRARGVIVGVVAGVAIGTG